MKNKLTSTLLFLVLSCLNYVHAQDQYLTVDGIKIRYVDEGAGPPVVLVHGFTSNIESNWRRPGIIDGLIEAGFRVIAFDNRGHGKSDKPHDPSQYGMKMVEDISRVMNHLKINRAHMMGYSMGARLANRFASDYPDRVLSLTLGGYGWGRASTPFSREDIETLMSQRTNPGEFDVDALFATRELAHLWELNKAELSQNTIPSYVIVGKGDDRISNAKEMINLMPTLQLIIVGGNHMSAVKDPEYLRATLNILKWHEKTDY